MSIESTSFVAHDSSLFSLDTFDDVHLEIRGRHEGSKWNISVTISGPKIREGKQEVSLSIPAFASNPVVIGLLDPNYQRSRNRLINLSDYLKEPFKATLSASLVGEKLLCTLQRNGKDLLFELGAGVQGRLERL